MWLPIFDNDSTMHCSHSVFIWNISRTQSLKRPTTAHYLFIVKLIENGVIWIEACFQANRIHFTIDGIVASARWKHRLQSVWFCAYLDFLTSVDHHNVDSIGRLHGNGSNYENHVHDAGSTIAVHENRQLRHSLEFDATSFGNNREVSTEFLCWSEIVQRTHAIHL